MLPIIKKKKKEERPGFASSCYVLFSTRFATDFSVILTICRKKKEEERIVCDNPECRDSP